MNKQEAIDKIKNLGTLKINDTVSHQQIDMVDKNKVLDIISQKDESQKVVVPWFVADWLEVCKEKLGFSLSTAMSHSTSAMKAQSNKVQGWFNLKSNQETFAKAWLFGYEVEKEKLYTAKVKIAAEFSYLNKDVDQGYYFMASQSKKIRIKTHFPQSELEDLGLWDNPAFEIEEVEE